MSIISASAQIGSGPQQTALLQSSPLLSPRGQQVKEFSPEFFQFRNSVLETETPT